jgi:mannose-6-phosphate isomerase-like protein (cupin superfamily)
MKRLSMLSLLVLSLSAGAFAADEPDGFVYWSAKDLAQHDKDLTAQAQKDGAGLVIGKAFSDALGKFGNHTAAMSHREADGKGELHEKKHDFFFVQSGNATLITGGTLVEDTPKANGEHSASSIKGGTETALGPGDIMHIPAGMPHQLLIKKGEKFTYFVIKVDVAEPAK